MFKFVACFVVFSGILLFPGCNYSLGSRGKLDFSTIEIAPIKNRADLPQAQATLARMISDSLNQEPELKTVTSGGNAELFVEISDYRRQIYATDSSDSVIASTVILTLKLKCSLRNSRTGTFYFKDREISVNSESYPGSATGLSETQVFPLLARSASRRVKDLVVGVW